jgi:hypothetical protein
MQQTAHATAKSVVPLLSNFLTKQQTLSNSWSLSSSYTLLPYYPITIFALASAHSVIIPEVVRPSLSNVEKEEDQ